MNTIDVREKDCINDKLYYDIIIDNEKTLCMVVSVDNDIATISYDGNMKVFNGFFGALLLRELLDYVLYTIDDVDEVRSYFDDDIFGLSSYHDQFNYQIEKHENGSICYSMKK